MSSEKTREAGRSEPCPPWCAGEHREADHPDDRYHDSPTTPVPVIFAERDREAGPGQWAMEPGEIAITTSQHIESDDVVVFIGREDRLDQQLNLTVESAARLARSIERHLDVVR